MSELIAKFATLPGTAIGGLVLLLLYAVQSEIRFGARARTIRSGPADRKSTAVLSLAANFAIIGFVLAVKADSPTFARFLPHWFRSAVMPGLPAVAWLGVAIGACGVALRLWAVLTLRERYTRTLLVQEVHSIERGGPYRFVRHPGYLGSLMTLGGIALASGNIVTLLASLVALLAAYAYRIKVEDEMLVAALGDSYATYRRDVGALLPSFRTPRA